MKPDLHEIEFGSENVNESRSFYRSVLGLQTKMQRKDYTCLMRVLTASILSARTHVSGGTVILSFLTDDLDELQRRLTVAGICFDGPAPSHLGMATILCSDPNGHLVKIDIPGKDSPAWLTI